MGDFDKLEAKVEREETIKRAEDKIAAARRPNQDNGQAQADTGEKVSYRDAFHSYLKAQGQLGSMSAEARAVLNTGFTQYEQRGQSSGVDSEGGFTVP